MLKLIKTYRELVYAVSFGIEGAMEADKKTIVDAALAAECDVPDILVSAMKFFNHDPDLIFRTPVVSPAPPLPSARPRSIEEVEV